jgi:hypothetical protein
MAFRLVAGAWPARAVVCDASVRRLKHAPRRALLAETLKPAPGQRCKVARRRATNEAAALLAMPRALPQLQLAARPANDDRNVTPAMATRPARQFDALYGGWSSSSSRGRCGRAASGPSGRLPAPGPGSPRWCSPTTLSCRADATYSVSGAKDHYKAQRQAAAVAVEKVPAFDNLFSELQHHPASSYRCRAPPRPPPPPPPPPQQQQQQQQRAQLPG